MEDFDHRSILVDSRSIVQCGASPLKEAEALCSHHLLQTLSLIDVAALCPHHLNKRKTNI